MSDTIKHIEAQLMGVSQPIITIDGPCVSGKTTLAASLAELLHGVVVHTDDYVIPHAMKTPERLAVPGGNCDDERLVKEVLQPWKKGMDVRYHRYDCRADAMLSEETLPRGEVLILEGSYSNLPEIRKFADMCLFLTVPWKEREARLIRRESPESLKRYYDLWIPLEDAYFAYYHLPDDRCIEFPG